MTADLNILAAWLGIFCGVAGGVALGHFFSSDDWLGGYASWRRRLMRLGHVSFFGIAFLNLAFAWTVTRPDWQPGSPLPSVALVAAQALMPLVCFGAALRKPLRHLFFLPVGCVLAGVGGLLLERLSS